MRIPKMQNQEREVTLSEAIVERRSTPSFDGSPVPDEELNTILRSGIEAPSSFNLQPWRFIVVRDAQQKRRLREAAMGQPKVEEAGAVIVCCGDPEASRGTNLEDVLAEATSTALPQSKIRLLAF
jgi:nitroreductase